MKNAFLNKIIKTRLPKEEQEEIKRLGKYLEPIIGQAESDNLKERAELIAELKLIPGLIAEKEKEYLPIGKAAAERMYKAEKEYYEAKEAYRLASLTGGNIGFEHQRREFEIKKQLTEGADPRILEYKFRLSRLEGKVI